ncbi:MAG: hypothetical protein P1U56_16295 [Saprospiraceae bacterium]|nr:hypothetical protein [Saprospiraceae bacterium]
MKLIKIIFKTILITFFFSQICSSQIQGKQGKLYQYYHQDKAGIPFSIFDEMNYQEVLKITIDVDLGNLLKDIRSPENYKAKLKFNDADGKLQVWDMKLALRGKFRRVKCSKMPPLKLKFKKKDLESKDLSTVNDLKLVTQCVEDKREAKALLLKEYLAYKIYNQLTDISYRVQLVEVTFHDTETGKREKQWAFLIEDTAQLRERLLAKKCNDCLYQNMEAFEQETFKLMSVFLYMIGNSDWSAMVGQNTKLIKTKDHILVIPYDFDFSGMVDAPYASVNPNFHLTSRKDRVYLGFEEHLEDITSTFQYFLSKKEEILNLVKKFKLLNKRERRAITKYLETFFEEDQNFKTKETYLELFASTVVEKNKS